MRLLLDAHVLLWATELSDRLRPETRDAIADPESEVFVSIATIWELSIKSNIGKLRLPPQGDCTLSHAPSRTLVR